MLVYSATIDSREYPLASAEDAERLKAQVIEASVGLGQYIDIKWAHKTTSVLVNGSTAVAFDVHDTEEAGASGVAPFEVYPDFETP